MYDTFSELGLSLLLHPIIAKQLHCAGAAVVTWPEYLDCALSLI